jgi:hypothetical protein
MSREQTSTNGQGQRQGGANTAMAIAMGLEAAGTIITAIGGVKDANQRRQFEQSLALLNTNEQAALSKALMATNSETERLRILKDTLTDLQNRRIDILVSQYGLGEKQERTKTIIIASIMGVVALGIIAYIYKKA